MKKIKKGLLQNRANIGKALVLVHICQGPLRNGSPWRGFFEPSTVPFRHERERVLTDMN